MRTLLKAAAAFALAGATVAVAADYPVRPIRVIVPFPAGGTGDSVMRQFQNEVANILGQPVVIDNKSGAGGRLGASEVAKSPPDGYTLLLVYDTYAVDPLVYKDMPYDQWKDFVPISLMVRAPLVAIVAANVPANDLTELVAYAKANPGKVDFGSTGVGSSNHLATELFAQMTGTKMTHIPYKGGAPAQTDLMAGRLALFWGTASFANRVMPGSGAKTLGVASSKRLASMPNLKTAAEQGIGAFEASAWIGMVAPTGTPREVIDKWRAALVKAAASAKVATWLSEQGFESMVTTPEEFGQFLRTENQKWAAIIKSANIPLQ